MEIDNDYGHVRHECSHCTHFRLCKYREEKQKYDDIINTPQNDREEPIYFALGCREFEDNKRSRASKESESKGE